MTDAIPDYHADSRISNAEYTLALAVAGMMETLCELGRSPQEAADAVRAVVGDKLNEGMGLG